MNLYADVKTLASVLPGLGAVDDTDLLALADMACREIDDFAQDRHFYSRTATRYFSGNGRGCMRLPFDLIAITTLKEDRDGDGVFETTWEPTDYHLAYGSVDEPEYDADPTGPAGLSTTRPFTIIEVNRNGTKGYFGRGNRRFEIVGKFGYSESTRASGATVQNNPLSDSATSVTVSDGNPLSPGQTLIIGTEQVYVQSTGGATLTVKRGVNGTTAAQHAQGTAIAIVEYPPAIVLAVKAKVGRYWMQQQGAFTGSLGVGDTGEVQFPNGNLINWKQAASPYISGRGFFA